MLPAKSGIEVCEEIRMTNQRIPILFLTALGTSENIVKGLSSGADDYLVKPFKFIELVARIKTLLRRITDFTIEEEEKDSYTFQDIELDDESKIVTRAGQPILLTSTEFRLLSLFLRSPNKVFSRTEILEDVWGINFDLGTNVVDVYVNYLRKKLEKGGKSRVIQTKIGMGYVLK